MRQKSRSFFIEIFCTVLSVLYLTHGLIVKGELMAFLPLIAILPLCTLACGLLLTQVQTIAQVNKVTAFYERFVKVYLVVIGWTLVIVFPLCIAAFFVIESPRQIRLEELHVLHGGLIFSIVLLSAAVWFAGLVILYYRLSGETFGIDISLRMPYADLFAAKAVKGAAYCRRCEYFVPGLHKKYLKCTVHASDAKTNAVFHSCADFSKKL